MSRPWETAPRRRASGTHPSRSSRICFAAALVVGSSVGLAAPPEKSQPSPFQRTGPTKPAEAEKTFQTLFGFQMQLLAAEPLVTPEPSRGMEL